VNGRWLPVNDEVFGLMIVPLSLAIPGVIFFIIGCCLHARFSYKKGGIKTYGELVGFRVFHEYYHPVGRKLKYIFGLPDYTDYQYNAQNSRPIFRFLVNGVPVKWHSDWSVADLDKNSIGKEFPIRYFPTRSGFRVILEGPQYEKQRARGQKMAFWIFASIGIGLFALAVFVTVLYFVVTRK